MTARAGERAVALMPMKGHSERIKGKNFKDFHGKPLFRWTLDTLLDVPAIDHVVIDTDARETFEQFGVHDLPRVQLRDRRPELRGDFVSMNLILEDDIAAVPADFYVMTHATNPLLRAGTIERAVAIFLEKREAAAADSLFAVNRFQSRFYGSDGRPINHDPSNLIRTQDLEPWFEENSTLYIFTAESFRATRARIGARPIMFETPRIESIDIDDQAGWDAAEAMARAYLIEADRTAGPRS
ncbi:MAG: acylneuraminate cytidylyltransferase family protein [Vicinamibacterales bacterium]